MDLSQLLDIPIDDELPLEAYLKLEPPQPPIDEEKSKSAKSKGKAKPKTFTCLEDVLKEFASLKEVSFQPFIAEEYQKPRTKLLEDFPANPAPLDYFSLYFTDLLFYIITQNTNFYANSHRFGVTYLGYRCLSSLKDGVLTVGVGDGSEL